MKVYGLVEVRAADDWERFVGDGHYRPGRSAYELARAWQTARGFPRSVDAVLKPLGLEPVRAFIEWPEFLDTDVGPSMTDLMIDAIEASGSPVAIGVEGKVDEPFGEKIRKWVRADKAEPTRTRVRRLEFLNEVLESDLDHDSAIYYQLLHRTASVVLRARAVGATTAVMLVH